MNFHEMTPLHEMRILTQVHTTYSLLMVLLMGFCGGDDFDVADVLAETAVPTISYLSLCQVANKTKWCGCDNANKMDYPKSMQPRMCGCDNADKIDYPKSIQPRMALTLSDGMMNG